MSFFKSFNIKTLLRNPFRNSYFSKNTMNFSKQTLFSSMFFSVSLFHLFKNYLEWDYKKIVHMQSSPPLEQKNNKFELENYSNEKYDECLKNKNDIILVLNLDAYKESFQKQIESDLQMIASFHQHISKKKLKIFKVDFKSHEELKNFEEKHNIKISEKNMLLIKNRYSEGLIKFNVSDYFQRKNQLITLLAKVKKLSQKNYKDFCNVLKNITNDNFVILLYNPLKSDDYENFKTFYSNLAKDPQFSGLHNITFLMIKEESIAKELKIENAKNGDFFILQKTSVFNHNKSNFQTNQTDFLINKAGNILQSKTNFEFIEKIIQANRSTNVFSFKGFDSASDFSLIVEIDLNKFEESELNMLYSLISDIHNEIGSKYPKINSKISFTKVHKNLKKKGMRIFIRNEQKIFKSLMEREMKSHSELENLYKGENIRNINEPDTFMYLFPQSQELNKENLLNFIEAALEKKIPPHFQTQKTPKFRTFSKKVVGKTFKKEIMDNDKTQVLMIYSKHCYACKRLGKDFEETAHKYLNLGRNDVEFNRMNSDHNDVDCMRSFNHTPVFLVFKPGFKSNPFIYLNQIMSPQSLKIFIENSIDVQVINDENVKKIYEESRI